MMHDDMLAQGGLVSIHRPSAEVSGAPAPDLAPARTLFQGREAGAFRFGSRTEMAIVRKAGLAIGDFHLIADGDRIMVCLSGGKDSYALLDALRVIARRSPVRFELLAVNVDQGWPGFESARIEAYLKAEGVPYHMANASYARIVDAKRRPEQTPCFLCARFRRAFIYELAQKLGCTKIALGHHLDDLVETLLLNAMFAGRLASMPPRLVSDDGRNIVIRPLAYVPEALTRAWAAERRYPIVRCGCPSCGLPDQKRQIVKRLLGELERESPGIKHQLLGSLRHVKPDHLLDQVLLEKLGAAR